MQFRIYGKKTDDEKIRTWINISEKNENGTFRSATIPCSLSKEAMQYFKVNAGQTANDAIRGIYAEVKEEDWWFKVATTKDGHDFAYIFINKLCKYEKAKKGGSW